MFDIGFWEVSLIAVLALIILGPERLPGVARTAGLWIGRARRLVAEVKADIKREIDQEELRQFRNIGEDLKAAGDEVAQAGSEVAKFADQDALSEDPSTPHETIEQPQQGAVAQDAKAE